ncbi:MAG: DksA/TraR family C4-type zinc finger protein [Deltaproteobacteria bacterium]|nr:DksA/TraR family C4-type zinc finger protein [Deltaproteobacteria bacterium]
MAGGFAKDGAVAEQIEASIDDAIAQVRQRIAKGAGLTHCEDCGEEIPLARRKAVAGVRRCIPCQQEHDSEQSVDVGYNRRGSKGSQLR